MKTMIITLATVANLTCGLVATAVSAQTVPTTTISYADLDLRSQAGVKTLRLRLRNAAASVCEGSYDGQLATRIAAQKCRTTAMAGAMKQVPDFATVEVASR